jgi:hypothetical protein
VPNNRDWMTRVDDAILVGAANLARLRKATLRGAIGDFQQTSRENAELSVGTDDADIWRLRIDRCDMLLAIPDDLTLRRRVAEAQEHDR